MTHAPEISAENPYQKTGIETGTNLERVQCLFVTENQYQKNLVLKCMSDAPETGTGCLVPVFGANCWHVPHWHQRP